MAFNITSSPTNVEILASLLGDTTGLSNIQITTTGNPLAIGLFQDSSLNLSSGVLLSTGQATRILGGNTGDRNNVSTVFNGSGTVLDGTDAIALEITFNADAVSRQLFFQYVFGSEEFLDFAGSSFNDRLTIELNGVNLAKLNNGNLVNVNSLTPGTDPNAFSPDYINNLSVSNPAYEQTVLDGYTVPITLQGSLLSNASNRLVITIQDVGDGAVDSAVFLAAGSLGVSNPIPAVNVTAELPGSVDEDSVSGILYTFTRSGVIDKVLSVNYQLGGTATFDTDYSSPNFPGRSGAVDFAAGSASTTLFISPKIDALVEGDETITVNLLPANNFEYNVGAAGSATGTILDEDTPLNNISLTILSDLVSEDSISGNLVYSFTRTGPTTESLRVDFDLGGTALWVDDYDVLGASFIQGSIGSITFSAGSDTTFLLIDPKPDNVTEPLETVGLTLTASRNDSQIGRGRSYIIDTPSVVTGNIIDAQPGPPSISLFTNFSIVGENDQTNLSYIFARTGSLTLPLTVQYFVRGTARLGEDYAVTGAASFDDTIGTVTFQAGSEFVVVDVAPTPDSVIEPTETVILQLDTIAGAVGGYNVNTFLEVVGSIADVATPIINVVLEPQRVDEGGSTNLFYGFSRTGSINNALTVNYNISGTATFGADYSQAGASSFDGTSGSITFAAGANTTNLQITAVADAILDPDETIALTLADSPNYAIGTNNIGIVTILDVPATPLATISLSLNRSSVDEDGTPNLSYTFTRTGETDQFLTVRYQITGTAIEGTDYSTLGTSTGEIIRAFTFVPGASNFTVRVDPTPDTLVEGNETVSLTLLPADLTNGNTGYIVGNSPPVTGLIIDAFPLPVINVTLSPASVTEGGQTNLVYLFSRTGSTAQPLTINYSIGGTAAFTTDYNQVGANSFTNTTGSITFAANSAMVTLAISPAADVITEPDEIVTLTLVGNSTYSIGSSSSASGTIVDVPVVVGVTPPTVTLAVNPVRVNEDGTTNLVYTFTRTGSTNEALRVDYDFGGAAAFGTDYTVNGANSLGSIAASGTVTLNVGTVDFAAGSDTAILTVDPTSDSISETDEVVTIQLTASRSDVISGGGRSYNISTPGAIGGTIVDATPTVGVTLNPSSVDEGGTTSLVYTFTRTGSTATALTATYSIGGTAAFGADYNQAGAENFTGTTGTITFAENSATATLAIAPAADSVVEPDETVALALTGSSTYAVGNSNSLVGTIVNVPVIINIPPTVNVAVNQTSVNEDDTANLAYTFTRTGDNAQALSVRYQLDGTATFDADYGVIGSSTPNGSFGTIDFAAGTSIATIFIDPISDTLVEGDETVSVTLLPAGNAEYTVGTAGTVSASILDQDTALNNNISLTVTPNQVTEDEAGNLVYTFTRTGSTAAALRVDYSVGGTASLGADYSVSGTNNFQKTIGSVDFAVGATTVTVVIDPTADNVLETNETVELTLIGAGYGSPSYIVNTPGVITGTIIEPATVVNLPPTQIVFNGSVTNNTFRIAENTSTANRIKIADIAITDDQLGTNTLSLSGTDVSSFELDGTSLFLRSGVVLDFETKTNYNLVVSVDDIAVGNTPDVINNFTLIVTDINEPPTGTPIIPIDNIAQNTSVRISRTVFLTGFTDPENDPLNVVNPIVNNGTIINNNDGTFTLTPNPDYSGPINITYGVTDGVNTLNGQLRSVIILPPENGLNFIGTTNLDVGAVNNLSNGIFAVNPNNINLVGDEINLIGGTNSVIVPGKRITLQPDQPNQNIQLGSTNSNSADILDLTPTDLAAIANGFNQIVLGRANGTGNISINSAITFRDPILLQSPGGQLNIAAPITLADDATLDFNVKSLVKSGDSILTISGISTTTFIGSSIINGGILLLAKAANTRALNGGTIVINSGTLQLGEKEQIDNAADLTLNGGRLNLNGFNETLDQLQVASNSSINLGNGRGKLAFGNSSSQIWAAILSIENWSSTSGETIRFGNNANGLTAAQLNNIQFVGFGRGATINASGFIAPIGSTVINPTPDQDGVNDNIEDLAPNDGDGNLDGILDSLQENVVSILNLGGVNVDSIATVIAKAGAKISGLRSLANPITAANLTSLANPIEFKVTGLTNGAATTVEYLIAKTDQNRNYNTYLMFGATADNLIPHAYEFLYDGQTGAELFDTNGVYGVIAT
jgi:Cadherin-like domain/Calx-beta domain